MQLTVKIDSAIAALEKNLEEHKVELREAMQGWTAKTIAEIEMLRDAVQRDQLKASVETLRRLFYEKPQDNRVQYSKYLSALKAAQGAGNTTVTMDEEEHDRIFNDNWDWRIQSKALNSSYKSR